MKVGDPFSLNIGNKRKYLCRPGVVGKKVAVQIVKKPAELEQSEFDEFGNDGEDLL